MTVLTEATELTIIQLDDEEVGESIIRFLIRSEDSEKVENVVKLCKGKVATVIHNFADSICNTIFNELDKQKIFYKIPKIKYFSF
jgi:hypothetical protein